jgi:hypothetical protein
VVKGIVRAQDLLAQIASRELTAPADIDAAIAELATVRTLIDQLPGDHRGSLSESADGPAQRSPEPRARRPSHEATRRGRLH